MTRQPSCCLCSRPAKYRSLYGDHYYYCPQCRIPNNTVPIAPTAMDQAKNQLALAQILKLSR